MKIVISKSLILGLAVFFAPLLADAQDLEGTLTKLADGAAKSYVSPIVSGFGSNMNGGWFHSAPKSTKLSFDFELGIVAMGTFFGDEHKTFSTTDVYRLDSSQAASLADGIPGGQLNPFWANVRDTIRSYDFTVGISGATVVGSNTDSIKITFYGQTLKVGPNPGDTVVVPTSALATPLVGILESLSFLPLLAPQFTIGTVFGTQASFRYLPEMKLDDKIGSFKYFGFGIQHNPGVWLGDPLPIDVSAGYFTQTLEVGTIFKTTTTSFGVQASKKLGFSLLSLTPYAGYQIESSTMSFSYTPVSVVLPDGTTKPIGTGHFDLEGENKSRLTVGLGLHLLFLNVNADYNIGTYNSFTVGIMLLSL